MMEIIIPVVIFILLFIACSVCGYCCKRNKQGIVYGIPAQPGITTTTTTYQTASNPPYQTANNPPYPVMDTPMPQPVLVPPPSGFAPHAAYPPTTPYPPISGAGYPPASGAGYPPSVYPGTAPYPTMPMPGAYTSPVPAYPANSSATQLPPTYDEATQNLGQNRNVNEVYSKQAPYNPNYN